MTPTSPTRCCAPPAGVAVAGDPGDEQSDCPGGRRTGRSTRGQVRVPAGGFAMGDTFIVEPGDEVPLVLAD